MCEGPLELSASGGTRLAESKTLDPHGLRELSPPALVLVLVLVLPVLVVLSRGASGVDLQLPHLGTAACPG